jgi:hypothetical protein
MGKKLAILGHSTRGKEVIELLKMLGGDNRWKASGEIEKVYYSISNGVILYGPQIVKDTVIFTLEEFLEKYPFKVGDKVFLYDNITEGCVTGMEWDENKRTVKYCVYTSAEYWCDVKELLKWNPIDFLEDKHCNEKQVNGMKNVLTELLNHIKNTPKEELEREFEEIKEWSNVGPTVEEFMTFCECVNKKPVYPTTYEECCEIIHSDPNFYIDTHLYSGILETLYKLLICRTAYWKIAGEEIGLGKPWEPKFGKYIHYSINFYSYQDSFVLHKGEYSSSDNCILVFPLEEMRDVFYENFKDLIEQCKELL